MLVRWLTASTKSTTVNLVSKETSRLDCHYLLIVVWTMIWEVGRVDITF